jgi:hypothetical protein
VDFLVRRLPKSFGLRDPAYVAPTCTEHVECMVHKRKPRQISAAELESYIRSCPDDVSWAQAITRELYDDQARLLARWCLEYLESYPEDAGLSPERFWRSMEHARPELGNLVAPTTYQKQWAHAVAIRLYDALIRQ